jgi:hypothetical protein
MSESPSPVRPRFFSGKQPTAADLAQQQHYFLERLKRHNRSLHGFGIVSGLKVTTEPGRIVVDAGMALDCEGNEVVIANRQTLSLPETIEGWPNAHVGVRYVENCGDPVTVSGVEEASTIREGFEIVFDKENYSRAHRHVRARWLACGAAHPLTIAKLRCLGSQGWRVDRRYRAPQIK